MSGTDLELCSVGKFQQTECHKKSYASVAKVVKIETLDPIEIELISLRSGVDFEALVTICEHHRILLLKKFETHHSACFDPFQCHKKQITKSLRTVSLDFSRKINGVQNLVKFIPGLKICDACRKKVNKNTHKVYEEEELVAVEHDDSDSNDEELDNIRLSCSKEESIEDINSVLANLEDAPLSFHAVPSHCRAAYTKRKLESVCDKLKSKFSRVLEENSDHSGSSQESNHDQSMGDSNYSECVDNTIQTKINERKANDLDVLIQQIHTKLGLTTNSREKIQILTLAPASWSKTEVCERFRVSEYAVRKSRELLRNEGILALPPPRKGHPISDEVINIVKGFYESDDYSRLMPGAKDKVSVSKNQHVQKRLILSNLNELYSAFKNEYPQIRIGFTKFRNLRPKWCVLAGSSGTHSVCVCTIHQNVTLLLHACSLENMQNEMIDGLVCSTENRDF